MCSCQRENGKGWKLEQGWGDNLNVGCLIKRFLQMTTSVKFAINFLPVNHLELFVTVKGAVWEEKLFVFEGRIYSQTQLGILNS